MPTVSQVVKIRHNRRYKESRSPWGRLGMAGALFSSMLILGAIVVVAWYASSLMRDMPSIQHLPALVEEGNGSLLQASKIFDRSHQHVLLSLENPAAEGRLYLTVSKDGQVGENTLSKNLVEATISIFDPDFWKEPGYSLKGIIGGTHPTLAQQLVSNLLLVDVPASIKRNVQERLLSMQITAQYGREKVLEWYLNSAEFGKFVYGADAAARVYLGKSATNLSIAEAALLTAIAESPGLDPWSSAQLLRQRQVRVIQQMLAYGWISSGEADEALRENVQIQPPQPTVSLAPDFTNLALLQIAGDIPLSLIYRGGYEIVTTLDYDLQAQAECAVKVQVDRLQGLVEQAAESNQPGCEAAAQLPKLQALEGKSAPATQAEVLILDPITGEILAWVGGDPTNLAPSLPVTHHAGFILSPFLYLTAFTGGMSPASLVWDLPPAGEQALSDKELQAYHGPVRLRIAMIDDYAGAAARVLQQVGLRAVQLTEEKFGINPGSPGPFTGNSLDALTSTPVSLLKVVQAYAVLANQGVMAGQEISQGNGNNDQPGLSANTVLQVIGAGGQLQVERSSALVRPIVSDQLAYLVTDVLSDEKSRSGSLADANIFSIGQPAAVKNSLSADAKDAWAVGYTPQLVVGVWMEDAGETTSGVAGGIWHALMRYKASQQARTDFVMPGGVSQVDVCDPSGLLISPSCPAHVGEVFLQGSEPTQVDGLYREFYIDRQTGLLATIFTPSEQVDGEVFLMLPAEAQAWGQAVGLPVPPKTYDEIGTVATASGGASITQPRVEEFLRGQVEIYGSATGDGFSYYRLQAGQGLNPQEWNLIGVDRLQPVGEGWLATWDTSGLDGEYILELQVVQADMRVEQVLLPVTIDNNPPQVKILAPSDEAQLNMVVNATAVLQADVEDDHALARLEFYMDDVLVSTLYELPFVTPWTAQPGEHTLRARVYDQAGNWSEAKIVFSVNR